MIAVGPEKPECQPALDGREVVRVGHELVLIERAGAAVHRGALRSEWLRRIDTLRRWNRILPIWQLEIEQRKRLRADVRAIG